MTLYQRTYGDAKATIGVAALHGGKGAGLLDMTLAGLPVPEALILTTEAWHQYRAYGTLPSKVLIAIAEHLDDFPDSMFSVRSGAPVSMPGMMDTLLNMGVTDELDDMYGGAFWRFATSWLGVVKGLPNSRLKELTGLVESRSDLMATVGGKQTLMENPTRKRKLLSGIIQQIENISIPTDRFEQAIECVEAVFKSWDTPRAKAYRAMHDIPESMGTACIIQRMVMGTADGLSGSGVMFSRNPATGENKMKGEFAFNAQGEEVVAGEVTPMDIDDLTAWDAPNEYGQLHGVLKNLCTNLEAHFGDVQDIEFTVEKGHLYVLQTRTAKMSATARIVTACDLAQQIKEGGPSKQLDYLKERVHPGMLAQTMVPYVVTESLPATTGLAASPGAISGKIVWADTPLSQVDKNCILVANETRPEDFPIMSKCGGFLTKTGGFTCHSAVVARGIGVPAVVGCNELEFTDHGVQIGNANMGVGTSITIDGATGYVFTGVCEIKKNQPPRELYDTLNKIVLMKGAPVPEEVYYYDCGIGDRVVLPIDPADTDRLERQLQRAYKLQHKGKTVRLAFELQGMGEDMFDPAPASIFEKLALDYGPDFKGHTILYGVPSSMAGYVADALGVTVNTDTNVKVLDLLDLLGTNA